MRKIRKYLRKYFLLFTLVCLLCLVAKEDLKNIFKIKKKQAAATSDFECTPIVLNNIESFAQLIANTEDHKHPKCLDEDWVLISDDGTLNLNEKYLSLNKISIKQCEYRGIKWGSSDFNAVIKQAVNIKPGEKLNLNEEFFQITCTPRRRSQRIYKSLFARIFSKRINKQIRLQSKEDPINVFFLGLDSVSREKWLTGLPRSSRYIIDDLQANILNGYNIVGDGTPAAIIPLLTSKHEHELPNTLKNNPNSSFVDEVYPFIWNNFTEKLNYATMYNEDWPQVGNIQIIKQFSLKLLICF